MQARISLRALSLALVALAGATSCGDPDTFLPSNQAGGPAGVLEGSVTYSGPQPCTENQHIVGAAVLLVFDTRLLPPPEGLGTTATSLAVVDGDNLFAGIRARLTFNQGGQRWCPDAMAKPVTVSHAWAAAPLPGGVYQVRGFYDLDGNFDPSFKIANLPTKGDVGGGAIENVSAVLMGAKPAYREITLGVSDGKGAFTIPAEGAHIGGVAVTLGLPLPLDRPVFYPKSVMDATPLKNTDPRNVIIPADYWLKIFSGLATETSLVRIVLGTGVPTAEQAAATASPFNLPRIQDADKPVFTYTRQDVNGDGIFDKNDHIPDSVDVPSLYPAAIFSKLVDSTPADPSVDRLTAQASPAVIIQALTIDGSLTFTATALTQAAFTDTGKELITGIRPAALCLDPADATKPAVLVLPHDVDQAMPANKILSDPKAVTDALGAQFHRTVTVQVGCLPEGHYAMNLVYDTGQAWTVPNEAGVCAKGETESADQKICGTRARLASQDAVLTIGPPGDKKWCLDHPVPDACKVH